MLLSCVVTPVGGSRWDTERMRAEANGTPFDVEMPSLELHAAQSANYALKYITKRTKEVEHAAQTIVDGCSACRVVDMAPSAPSSEQAELGRRRIVQLLNQVHGKIVVPQSLAALHLCGFGDFFMTHKTTPYYPTSFASYFRHLLAPHLELHFAAGKEMASAVYADGRMSFVRLVDDYVRRPDSLRQFPAYLYLMSFEKVPNRRSGGAGPDSTRNRLAANADGGLDEPDELPPTVRGSVASLTRCKFEVDFQHGHPQASSHTIVRRTELHLPQAISNHHVQPDDEGTAVDKELYALAVLSMFMSDRLLLPLRGLGYRLWDIFVAWRNCPEDVCFDLLFVSGYDVHATCEMCADVAEDAEKDAAAAAVAAAVPHYAAPSPSTGLHVIASCERPPALLGALSVLKYCKPAAAQVQPFYEHWHKHGRMVVKHIQNLAVAQAEDRRRSALLHRAHLRRAGKLRELSSADLGAMTRTTKTILRLGPMWNRRMMMCRPLLRRIQGSTPTTSCVRC